MSKYKKGGIGIVVLVIILFMASTLMLLDTYERKTLYLKRQHLQNVLTSANLSLYDAVRRGNPEQLLPKDSSGNQLSSKFNPEKVEAFYECFNATNTNTALKNKYSTYELASGPDTYRDILVNLSAINYLTENNIYKCIHIHKEEAYDSFAKYLEDNLGLVESNYNGVFVPKDGSTSGIIESITINSFYVRNAISLWDSSSSTDKDFKECCDFVKNSKETAVHIDMSIEIRTYTNLEAFKNFFNFGENGGFQYKKTTTMPMHIDTVINYSNL